MLKKILSCILLFSSMVISATANAVILVNHHGHPFQESEARHSFHQRASHRQSAHRPIHHVRQQHHYYRSDTQHRKVVINCLRMKNGHHYRVC